jgi:hypothetical protein
MNSQTEIEFGSLAIGTKFTIDTSVTFEKTSDRDAKVVDGHIQLLGISYQFGASKPVRIALNIAG